MEKINRKNYIFLLAFSIFAKLLNSLASPLFPEYCFQGDNVIFYLMGKELLNGKVLYKDLMDNKTPLIYFTNAIANLLSYKHIGLYIIEVIFMFITLVLVYKIIVLYTKNYRFNLVSCFIFGVFLNNSFISLGMSKTESYFLPFSLALLYILIKYLKNCDNDANKELNYKEVIAMGAFGAISFLYNQKAIFYFMPCYLIILVKLIYEKEYRYIVKYSLQMFSGAFISFMPFIMYAIATDSIDYAYFNIVKTAINYVGASSSYTSNANAFSAMFNYMGKHILFFMLVYISLFIVALREKNVYVKSLYFTSLVFNIYSVSSARNNFVYYIVSLYPFVLPLLILISKIFEVKSNYVNKVKEEGIVKKHLSTVVIFVIMLLVNIPIGYTNVKNQYNTRAKLNNKFRTELSKYYSDLNEIKILALAFNPEVYMSTNMKLDFPCFFTMNNTYERASYYYQQQLKYVREEMADVVVIRPESTFIYFPIPMQEEIYNKLEESYERVEDIDSESNYGLYNIYKKKK